MEIDTHFYDANGNTLPERTIKWTDTLGGSNTKHSYNSPTWETRNNLAHVEAVEPGTHIVTVEDQANCRVTKFWCTDPSCGYKVINGPGSIAVTIKNRDPITTKPLFVQCAP